MNCYLKGYIALAVYILLTRWLHVSFWQIEYSARPVWLAGAVIVLIGVVFLKKAPGRRSRRERG